MNNSKIKEIKSEVGNNNIFFVIEFFLCFLMIFGVLWNHKDLTSGAFIVSFITLLLEFVGVNFRIREVKMLWQVIFIFLVSLICVMISYIHNAKLIEFDTLKEYILFLTAIIYMFLCCHLNINKKGLNFILEFNLFIGFVYYLAYRYAPRANDFSVGLDFNFGNPNFAGMWLFQSLLYCTLAFMLYRQPIMKIISAIPTAILIYLINKTGARNCLLAYVLFIAVCVWCTVRRSGVFPKKAIGFICSLPIVFVPVYLTFIDYVVEKGWLSFLVSRGKKLNSRVKIWNHFINKLGNRWLTGEYLTCYGNSHNSHMVVLCSYGVITLALVIYFTYTISVAANEKANDRRNGYCLAAFFATMFMGFGEGALFAGGIGLYIMGCSFLCMARYDFSGFDSGDDYNNKLTYQRIGREKLLKDKKRNLK